MKYSRSMENIVSSFLNLNWRQQTWCPSEFLVALAGLVPMMNYSLAEGRHGIIHPVVCITLYSGSKVREVGLVS